MVKMVGQIGLLITIIIMVLSLKRSFAVEYVVGDDFGWKVPPNVTFYSEWANSKNFQIGDTVVFNLTGDQDKHDLGEALSLEKYQNCTDMGLTHRNLHVPVHLKSNGSRFFLSTIDDQCERGMRVIVTVGSPTNDSVLGSNSPSSLSSMSFGAVVATALTTFFVGNLFN